MGRGDTFFGIPELSLDPSSICIQCRILYWTMKNEIKSIINISRQISSLNSFSRYIFMKNLDNIILMVHKQ